MGLTGKTIIQIDTKCDADVIYNLLRYRPNDLSIVAPVHVQSVILQEGQWGAIGSTTSWNYFLGGKPQVTTAVIEAADDNKKSLSFRKFGGEWMKVYKSLKTTACVNQNDEKTSVTWTFEYEKISEDVPEPNELVDFANNIINALDNGHSPALAQVALTTSSMK